MTSRAALRACRNAYTDTYTAFAIADPTGNVTNAAEVAELCATAYKSAMPALTDWTAIRAHIACVSQGQLMAVISEKEARTLLFAAQTALSTWSKDEKHT